MHKISLSICCPLINFITGLHSTYHLQPTTLFLSINLMDHYMSKCIIHKRQYKLIGCVALLLTAKYEDMEENLHTGPEMILL